MVRRFKNYYHLLQAASANVLYNFPSKELTVIGVTGTDGKTTTSSILFNILKEAGYKTALVTTIGAYIHDDFYETGLHTTTPSARTLQKYIKKAKQSGCTHLVLEITSHGLDQNRAWGIPFQIGVITNVTHEHLDYHKTYERYVKAKSKLLRVAKIAILNKDDASYPLLTTMLKNKPHLSYSLKKDELLPKEMKIIGAFNKQNALAAATAAKELGVSEEVIKQTVSSFTAPEGRQEIIHDDAFKVIIDFAHTPNAFEQVLPVIKKQTKGRLIHVFGAAGKRDMSKRPEMGRASSTYADTVILTAEDPRGEDMDKINSEIKSGFVKKPALYEYHNRKEAIRFALGLAKKGDSILLTGKGHEKSINYNGKEEAWSDKETVFEVLNKVL
ncbi:MAG: Mur ligase family protein [Candidatus Levyibacteriota bacterium]